MKYCPDCKTNYPDSERFCPTEGRLLSLPDPYHLVGRTLLEKYRIEALVGLGGMGAVYSAHHLTINRHVAIKILQPNLALGNRQLLELFQREAEMAGQLNHENIVDIKDAGQTPDNLAYIVMEWLEGRTLEEEIEKNGQISFARAAAILRQVAAALDHAHARHIIHRDLKPSNIMLVRGQDGREQVKVVDFGIAKVISESATPVSLLLGTPHYASPEQFIVGKRLDGRSDIYSLGVTLYRMLCGNLPYTAQTLQDLIRLQRTALPPPIRQYRPEAPEVIERLLFRMLDLEPRNRPQRALDAFNIFAQSLNEEANKTGGMDLDWPTTASGIILPAGSEPSSNRVEGIHVSDTVKERIVATDKKLPARTVAARAVASLPQTVRVEEPQAGNRKAIAVNQDPKKYAIAAALALAIFASLSALYFGMIRPRLRAQTDAQEPALIPAPISGNPVELMSYYLDISSDDCRPLTRGTGDEALNSTQFFRFHFVPQRSGYLYIIAQNEKNVPMTFLTAHPDPEAGVRTNFVEAGSDYIFPPGDGDCIGIIDERMMAFTIILSPTLLASPGFLAAPAMRELNSTEQYELIHWRLQHKSAAPQIRPDAKHQLTRVTIANESASSDQPVIFDLPVKRR